MRVGGEEQSSEVARITAQGTAEWARAVTVHLPPSALRNEHEQGEDKGAPRKQLSNQLGAQRA